MQITDPVKTRLTKSSTTLQSNPLVNPLDSNKSIHRSHTPNIIVPITFGSNGADKSPNIDQTTMAGYLQAHFDTKKALETSEIIPVTELFKKVNQDPTALLSPHQRIYRVIQSYGEETKNIPGALKPVRVFKLFTEAHPGINDYPMRGVEESIEQVVEQLEIGLEGTEQGRRVLLLLGEAGGGKTEMINILKRAFTKWSEETKNPVYTLKFVDLPADILKLKGDAGKEATDPKLSNPLLLLPFEVREKLQQSLNDKFGEALGFPINSLTNDELSGWAGKVRDELLKKYMHEIQTENSTISPDTLLIQASLRLIEKHARAQRIVIQPGSGIGYLDAKAPEFFDITTLAGDVHPALEAKHGSAQNPLAFDYGRGKIYEANGGLFHFDEMLKTKDVHLQAFLQIGQEGRVQGISGVREKVNTAIMATSNLAEYMAMRKKTQNTALFRRLKIVKFRYTRDKNAELQIYKDTIEKLFKKKNIFIAPHALETAALFAVMTRMVIPDKEKKDILPVKADLYAGEFAKYKSQYKHEKVAEWRKTGETNIENEMLEEGFIGLGSALMKDFVFKLQKSHHLGNSENKTLDGFAVIKALKQELEWNTQFAISDTQKREHYMSVLTLAQERLDEEVSQDVQSALESDDELLQAMYFNYLERVKKWAASNEGKQYSHTNEKGLTENLEKGEEAMQLIETKLGKKDQTTRETFRWEIAGRLSAATTDNSPVTQLSSNPQIKKVLVEILKDSMSASLPLEAIRATNPDEKQQLQQSRFFERMAKKGYNEVSALNALKCYERTANTQ